MTIYPYDKKIKTKEWLQMNLYNSISWDTRFRVSFVTQGVQVEKKYFICWRVCHQLYSATIYYLVRLNICVDLLVICFLDANYRYVAFDLIQWVEIFSFLLFTEFFERIEVFPQTDCLPFSSFTYYKCVCGQLWVFTTFHDQINPPAIDCSLHCILIFCFFAEIFEVSL